MVFLFTVNIPSALALYWLTSGVVAIIQQWLILRDDTVEMESKVDNNAKDKKEVIEGEVVESPAKPAAKTAKRRKGSKVGKTKRRKK